MSRTKFADAVAIAFLLIAGGQAQGADGGVHPPVREKSDARPPESDRRSGETPGTNLGPKPAAAGRADTDDASRYSLAQPESEGCGVLTEVDIQASFQQKLGVD
ncbi:MAG TPA: hypothetical protein VMT03_12350 [Polyangia bacterium]|nr:hypothetical protein [Polyangia bacterium]